MTKLLLLSSDHRSQSQTYLFVSSTAFRGKWTHWKGQFVRFHRFHVKLPWRLQVITERTKRRRLLFPSKLALSQTDKMKPDWTRSNRGSCKEEALWLTLCSFNKLSPKGRRLGSKQHWLSFPHRFCSCAPCLHVQGHVENAGTCGILSRCLERSLKNVCCRRVSCCVSFHSAELVQTF